MRGSLNIILAISLMCSPILVTHNSVLAQSSKMVGGEQYRKVKRDGAEKGKASVPGLEDYMIIVKNNLFMPLGSGGEVKREEFVLTGILGRTALIQLANGSASYYVSEGESFGNGAKLIRVGENSVTIAHEGNRRELKLGEGSPGQSKGTRSERRGKQPLEGEQTQDGRRAQEKRMGEDEERRAREEEMERREHTKRKIEDLNRKRDEIKVKILEMEREGHVPNDAYGAVEEIDRNIRELEDSLR